MKATMYSWLFLFFCLAAVTGCSKKDSSPATPPDKIPQPYTDNFDSLTATSVRIFGGLYTNGGQNVTEAGFCWSTDSLPTLADKHVQIQLSVGFYATIIGLSENTTYHIRAYAKNSAGLAYGNSVAVTTITLKPIVQISDIFLLSSSFAYLDCKIISEGNAPVIASGLCWSTNPNPTINDDTSMGTTAMGDFQPLMDGLTVNTKYYVRAYATNSYGTGYSDTMSVIPAYYIGEVFGGGKIVYIDPSNIHGLIAANQDQSNGSRWDNDSYAEWTFAWSDDDGVGNTDKIITAEGDYGNAASVCRNYTGGGHTDWFLPALYQLHYLFDAKDKIGNVTPYYYWSSSESSTNIASAWVVRMDTQNGSEEAWTKSYSFVVRPFRSF